LFTHLAAGNHFPLSQLLAIGSELSHFPIFRFSNTPACRLFFFGPHPMPSCLSFITMLLTGFIALNISCIFWPQLIQQICGFCLAFGFSLGFSFGFWVSVFGLGFVLTNL